MTLWRKAMLAWFGLMTSAHAASLTQGEIVRQLIATQPRELDTLAAIVGPLSRTHGTFAEALAPVVRKDDKHVVREVHASVAIDVYHQDPVHVKNPGLESYALTFAQPIARDAFSVAPQRVRNGDHEYDRYGDFYVRDRELLWFYNEPDFAKPRFEADAAAQLIAKLAALFSAPITHATLDTVCVLQAQKPGSLDAWSCETPHYTLVAKKFAGEKPTTFTLRFRRPFAGDALLKALGLDHLEVAAHDVHMTTRHIQERASHRSPVRQGYAIEIELDPDGLVAATSGTWQAKNIHIAQIRGTIAE